MNIDQTMMSFNNRMDQAGEQYVIARQKALHAGHYGKPHSHSWYQLMYASAGLMSVAFTDQLMVVPPQKAIWLPPDCVHNTISPAGAQFCSLYFRPDKVEGLGNKSKMLNVSSFTRELILELVTRCDAEVEWQAKDDRLLMVLLDQLMDQPTNELSLLVPKDSRVAHLVTSVQADPSHTFSLSEWADALGMSRRTLSRIFIAETGVGFKEWRQKVRLLHSLSLLEQGLSVTQVALEVGYQSSSAFSYAFQQLFHVSPKRYFL